MADLPLRTAIDRRLGRPLPHQLANLTQVHHKATARKPPLTLRHYAVLAIVSNGCPPLYGRSLRVTHPSATRQLMQASLLPSDLHVLSIPPAFNLSQDQTLQFNLLKLVRLHLILLLNILPPKSFSWTARRDSTLNQKNVKGYL